MNRLSFSFAGQEKPFFEGLSITLEAGKLYFLRGENGAGKSTLMRLLQGQLEPGEKLTGSLELNGKQLVIPEQEDLIRSMVSMVPQKFDEMLANQLSFEKNLSLARMDQYPGLTGLPALQAIPNLVARFGIDMHKPVHLLSGGQRQVLSILMALQKNASILLLDEPTAALDEHNSAMVMHFLHELVATLRLTVLIICHDRELVMRYAEHGYFELIVDQGQRRLRKIDA